MTVKLTIHHLTREEADAIFQSAVEICDRELRADMFVEIFRNEDRGMSD